MQVSTEIFYPTASPEQVFAMGTDSTFRAAVCEATRAKNYDVDITPHQDGRASVTVRRTLPADLPSVARRILGETVNVVQREEWSVATTTGARTADLVISISGQPVQMVGSVVLEPAGGGVRMRIRGDVKVSIPFVGATIEGVVAKAIVAAADKEQQTGRRWLSEPT